MKVIQLVAEQFFMVLKEMDFFFMVLFTLMGTIKFKKDKAFIKLKFNLEVLKVPFTLTAAFTPTVAFTRTEVFTPTEAFIIEELFKVLILIIVKQ